MIHKKVSVFTACLLCAGITVLFATCGLWEDTEDLRPVLLTGIEITGYPDKSIYFFGEESLDLAGLEVTAIYSNDSREVVEDYTHTGFNSDTFGSKDITVNYQEHTAGFSVNVVSNFTDVDDIMYYLRRQTAGVTIDDPVFLPKQIDLGIMTEDGSPWRQLLEAIQEANKFVNLDLSACTMDGTEFNPDSSISTGKNKIVSLVLPNAALVLPDAVEIPIPHTEGDYSYTPGFFYFTSLESVSGANIETIGNFSFDNLTNLKSVSFPATETIGRSAFLRCTNLILTGMSFPRAVTIGNYAFYGCTSFTGVNFPAVETIGRAAFYDCTNLTDADFPAAVNIGGTAFARCTNLSGVNIPAAVSVGDFAFDRCTSLTGVSFPEAEYIGYGAFEECTSLASVNIPAVINIARRAFGYAGTVGLTIIMGPTAPRVDDNIFEYSNSPKTVTVQIPAGAAGYGESPTDTTTQNWGNAFRGMGMTWDGSEYRNEPVNQNITLVIELQD